MSHTGSRVGDNIHNEEVEQVVRDMDGALPQHEEQGQMGQNGEIKGAAHVNQGPPNGTVPSQLPQQLQPVQQFQQFQPPPLQQYPSQPPQFQPPKPVQQPLIQEGYEGEHYYQEATMGELSAPNFRNQPWCIYEGPELEMIEIKAEVVHHLPKFSGRQGESATMHLQRYHGSCQTFRQYEVTVENFKLKAFYFSLIDAAND
ncbi:unnamed protein product [Rhodiola kirilowii]